MEIELLIEPKDTAILGLLGSLEEVGYASTRIVTAVVVDAIRVDILTRLLEAAGQEYRVLPNQKLMELPPADEPTAKLNPAGWEARPRAVNGAAVRRQCAYCDQPVASTRDDAVTCGAVACKRKHHKALVDAANTKRKAGSLKERPTQKIERAAQSFDGQPAYRKTNTLVGGARDGEMLTAQELGDALHGGTLPEGQQVRHEARGLGVIVKRPGKRGLYMQWEGQ